MHGQTCQSVLGFSHSVDMCGRKRLRRKKGHTHLIRLNKMGLLISFNKMESCVFGGKTHTSCCKADELVGPNGNLIWVSFLTFQITVFSGYLHCTHCSVLVGLG